MSGKPVAGGPQQAPQRKSQTPAASVPEAVSRPSASSAKTSDDPGEVDEADPFDIDSTADKNVIPIRPKPSQGRSVKVVCPMCDTPGFIAKKAAGRDVRCCNSNCMVPVFTAPAIAADPRAAADEVSESSGLWRLLRWHTYQGGEVRRLSRVAVKAREEGWVDWGPEGNTCKVSYLD